MSKRPDFADEAVRDLPPLCTTKEAAHFLRISLRHLFRYISSGRLKTLQHEPKGQVLIPRSALADYLRSIAEGR